MSWLSNTRGLLGREHELVGGEGQVGENANQEEHGLEPMELQDEQQSREELPAIYYFSCAMATAIAS